MSKQDNKTLKDFMDKIPNVVGVEKIILVASAKGGVVKSTEACNLAISIAQSGKNVALIDADIYGPSVAHLLDLKDKPELKDNLLQPILKYGLKIISIANLVDANQAGIWRGPMVTKILYQLIRAVNWQCDNKKVEVMIVDMPPGTGDVYLSMAEKFPLAGVVLVSTPQSIAVIDVVKSIDCFKKLNVPILGLIQNMSYWKINNEKNYIFGQDGGKKIAQEMNIKFLGEIAIEPEISKACEEKIPFIANFFDKKINNEITTIFSKISQEILKII
jgi:ATP-binding protein involved in chromosome partitioning